MRLVAAAIVVACSLFACSQRELDMIDNVTRGVAGSMGGSMSRDVDYTRLPLTVVCWGDSLTNGGDYFPWMPAAWTMVERAESGDEWYNDISDRLIADIGGGEVGSVAVLFGGTNDVRQDPLRHDDTVAALTAALDVLGGWAVVVVMPPPIFEPDGGDEIYVTEMAEYRAFLVSLPTTYPSVALADIYTVFQADADPQSLYIKSNETNDGVHPWGQNPNFRGRIMEAEVITAAVARAMALR